MLFHTSIFAVFFLITFVVYLPLRKTRFYTAWLMLASYGFYAWWNPLYLLLIIYSTLIDYTAVLVMQRSRHRKRWLAISIVNNLALLGFFKYSAFIAENFTSVFSLLGVPLEVPAPGVLLPVGISFYAFQSMSYTIDFYRGQIEAEKNFVRFAAYVALFPQLVAGPIERARNLLPQLRDAPAIRISNISDGLSLFVVGLFKKVAIADYLAMYVQRAYETAEAAPEMADSASLILATFAFGWVIYCDFSGYTDMARGVAKMMGFDLMINFKHPYLAKSLGDFWRRWHISLSTWFRDYVYIPLGGNRQGKFMTYMNMTTTMLISAVWHGAAWHFIAWGALHAAARIATREMERTSFYRKRVPALVKQMFVYVVVNFIWIFFAANSIGHALTICSRIFAFDFKNPNFPILGLLLMLGLHAYQYVSESKLRDVLGRGPVKVVIMVGMILYMIFTMGMSVEEFIYFQF